jgi:hypothetical protein
LQEIYKRGENNDFYNFVKGKYDTFSRVKWSQDAGELARQKKQLCKNLSIVFDGPPGTGKTSMAELYAEFLVAMGFLKTPTLAQIDGSDLISGIVNSGSTRTQKFLRENSGKVMLIDEAYGMIGQVAHAGGDGQGQALTEVMRAAERGEIIIMAGYKEEMNRLLSLNQGSQSRLENRVSFRDFTPDQLCTVFMHQLESQSKDKEKLYGRPFKLEKTGAALNNEIKAICVMERKIRAGQNPSQPFGNGRFIEKLVNATLELALNSTPTGSQGTVPVSVNMIKRAHYNMRAQDIEAGQNHEASVDVPENEFA